MSTFLSFGGNSKCEPKLTALPTTWSNRQDSNKVLQYEAV